MEIPWQVNHSLATLLTVLSLIKLWQKWGFAALLNPFNYFLITWLLSLLTFRLAIGLGLDWYLINSEPLISELFFLVAFTSGIILLSLLLGKRVVVNKKIDWKIPHWFLKIYGYAILLLGIYALSSKGFDVVGNRLEVIEVGRDAALKGNRPGLLGAIIGVLGMLRMPVIIYNGLQFYQMIVTKTRRFQALCLFVLIGSSLEIIAGGGRAGIVQYLTFFGFGFIFVHFKSPVKTADSKMLKRVLLYALPSVLLLSSYINYVSAARAEAGGVVNVTQEYLSKSALGDIFFGVMEYSLHHIVGYQLRMNDTKTEELEMGQYTFQFITRYNLPVVSQLIGSELNIAKLLDLKAVNVHLENLKAESSGKAGARTTATIYFVLQDDFGFFGTLFIIFLFTIFTSVVFNIFVRGTVNDFWSIIILLFLFDLWKKSWFSHHLNGTIFNAYLYSAVLLTIIKKLRLK